MNIHNDKEEAIQQVLSYGTGGSAISIGLLYEVANVAQALALILGCLLVGYRLYVDISERQYKLKQRKEKLK